MLELEARIKNLKKTATTCNEVNLSVEEIHWTLRCIPYFYIHYIMTNNIG